MMTIFLIGIGVAVVILVIGLIFSLSDERTLVEERLGRFTKEEISTNEVAKEKSRPIADWLNTQAGRTEWGRGTTRELARADIKLRAGEYFALIFGTTLGGIFLGWLLGGRDTGGWLAILLGGVVGFFIPRFYVRREQGRRLIRFDNQLADMLGLMVNGLRAGYSTMQAMESVSRELPPPISDEFRRVVQEIQLGVPMEIALDNLLRRIPSRDLDLVITAVNVQREVGGNLAEILDTISHTIRERVRVKGEIRVLTSQVMMSGKFLALMPIGMLTAMYFFNRNYLMHYFDPETKIIGIPVLIFSGFIILIGYFTMTRIADIEV